MLNKVYLLVQEYQILKKTLVKYELEVMYVLCYDLTVETGYTLYILHRNRFLSRMKGN